jgi:UDP-glucuronate 4-epimerase
MVVGVDNFDPFYPREIKEANIAAALTNPRFTLIESDIREAAEFEASLVGHGPFDAIVHLAAKAGVRPSIEDPIGYQITNVMGTQNVLEYARKFGIKQFVFASSSSVYGVNPRVPWREDDTVLMPISPYASTKVSGELLGHVYSHLYGIRFIALRFFTVYGPRQRPDLAIAKFTRLALAGKSIPFFGDGSSRRDYTYVADIVNGICAAIEYAEKPYEILNLGNSNVVSLKELVTTLESALMLRIRLDVRPSQDGDVPQTWACLENSKRVLGYIPRVRFVDGIVHFVEWLRSPKVLHPHQTWNACTACAPKGG